MPGLSGGLLAHYLTFIQPSIFSMDLSGLLTAGVVAGGMGSLTGPVVAIALFVGIPELFRGLALWRLVLYGVVLVVIINYRPKGLFGYEELSVANFPKLLIILGASVALAVGVGIYNYYAELPGRCPRRVDWHRCWGGRAGAQPRRGPRVDALGCAAFWAAHRRGNCSGGNANQGCHYAAGHLRGSFYTRPRSAHPRMGSQRGLPPRLRRCSRSPACAKHSAASWR